MKHGCLGKRIRIQRSGSKPGKEWSFSFNRGAIEGADGVVLISKLQAYRLQPPMISSRVGPDARTLVGCKRPPVRAILAERHRCRILAAA